jgi:transposase
MVKNTVDNTASVILGERSREALLVRLTAATTTLGNDAFLELMVELLLQSGLDRDRLKQRVANLIASRFGASSEKASDDQLALFARLLVSIDGKDVEPDSDPEESVPEPNLPELMAQTETDIEALVAQQRQAKKEERERRRQAKKEARANGEQPNAWPSHLPVREVIRDVPDHAKVCDDCEVERKVIGYETSWRFEQKTETEVVVTKTPVLACPKHHGGPVTEPVEPKPVDGGRMGFTLAARVLYLRYSQNLPVCRVVEMLNTDGVPVSEEMAHTLIRVTAKRAQPVVEALAQQVRQAKVVNLDDTPVRVLKKNGKPHRHKARVWLALGDEKWAWFFATKNWKANEAERRLGKITGTVQGDGYPGYPKFARNQGVDLAGCMGHARRKFLKAMKTKDPRAGPAMALIQGMYRVEKLARLRNLGPDEIVTLRQERSAPLMVALERWAVEVAPSIVEGSPLGKAWTYLNNQWSPLQVFLTDGHVSLTNDAAERGLRRITIGRKLWLFFQNDKNAEWAAKLASLMATARLHGANELAYITWLLGELARREWSPEAARSLLPDVWLAAQQEQPKESARVQV